MFYHFFLQYKYGIYNAKSKNKNNWKMKFAVFALYASGMFSYAFLLLQMYKSMFVFLLAFILVIIGLYRYRGKIRKNRMEEEIQKYKDSNITPLLKMLKSEIYQLYSIAGVNQLIEFCIDKFQKELKLSVPQIISSLCGTAFIGYIGTKVGIDIIQITLIMMSVLIAAFILLKCAEIGLNDYIMHPDKNVYCKLKEDLEYIKVQLKINENLDDVKFIKCKDTVVKRKSIIQ